MKRFLFCIFCLFLGVPFFGNNPVAASEIVWKPINPSFVGGNPLNGAFLLNEAQLQNDKHLPRSQSISLQDSKHTLNRQTLNRVSSELFDAVFGENGLKPGRHTIGGFVVDVAKDRNGLSMSIIEPKAGRTTTVEVPYY